MRRLLEVERMLRLGENSLFLVGEERVFMNEEQRLMNCLLALDEADDLQEAEAHAAVEEAEKQLRNAKYRLIEIKGRNETKDRIYEQYRKLWESEAKLLGELATEVANDTAALGITNIVRPELLALHNGNGVGA